MSPIDRNPSPFLFATAATLAVIGLYSTFQSLGAPSLRTTYAPPIDDRTKDTDQDLAYPPTDFLPGARDVFTPYGSIRAYEFGPPDSPNRVLFVHGISTPCVSLFSIAFHLATKRGCRVLLMDLFGRGWSGGPVDLSYDNRLYASQIFMTLASSDVHWTDDAGFALVGYSMGGGVAADFASYFPGLVNELVLIAPSGIVRESHISWRSRVFYSEGWLPESWLQALVRRRLRTTPNVKGKARLLSGDHDGSKEAGQTSASDAVAAPAAELPSDPVKTIGGKDIDIESAVNWQIDNNAAFMPAFMSSIRHAPIHRQHERWAMVGRQMKAQRKEGRAGRNHKVLLLLAGKDPLVIPSEVAPDAKDVLGEDNVVVQVYEDAGHELPITHAREVGEAMWRHWSGS